MKKLVLSFVAIVIAVVVVIIAIMLLSPGKSKVNIQIYGHRGARGLSPENTLPAYKTGLAIGINTVDMDVNMTKDGVVVATHNFKLDPDITRDANGDWIDPKNPPLIKDLTFKDLQTYDVGRIKPGTDYSKTFAYQYPVDGTHISSLKQVIEYVKSIAGDKVKFQVEIKIDPTTPDWSYAPATIAAATVKVLKEEGVDTRTELQAFDWRVLYQVQKLDPKIATAYLTNQEQSTAMASTDPKVAGLWTGGKLLKDYHNSIPYMIKQLGGKIWGPESKQLNAKLVKEAHKDGLRVVTWSMVGSLDSQDEIIRMFNIGVDAVISDRPDVVRGLFAARGIKVPPAFFVDKIKDKK